MGTLPVRQVPITSSPFQIHTLSSPYRQFTSLVPLHQSVSSHHHGLHHRSQSLSGTFSSASVTDVAAISAALSAAATLCAVHLNTKLSQDTYESTTTSSSANNDKDNEQDGTRRKSSSPPSTVEDIWAQAWAGLDIDTNVGINNTTSTTRTSTAAEPSTDKEELLTSPLLWVQGLNTSARRRLLALSLASLESILSSNAQSALIHTSSSRSDDVATIVTSIFKTSSVAVARAWLGYVPVQLELACRYRDHTCMDWGKDVDAEGAEEGKRVEGGRVSWYAVEERMGVYSSVLRLLQSQTFVPSSSSSSSSSTIEQANEEEGVWSLRANATQSLFQSATGAEGSTALMSPNSTDININGWSAMPPLSSPLSDRKNDPDSNSTTLLFLLAPSVLQDMAVRIADAVAAAYMDEASQGTWNPAAASTLSSSTVPPAGPTTTTTLTTNNKKTVASLESSWWPIFIHPRLSSTRQLQRFTNRLFASRTIDQLFFSVAAVYEDTIPLFTLHRGMLRVLKAPMRRSAQLAAYTGWRYVVSLVLEAVDVLTPVVRVMWEKVVTAVVWVLRHGVGRGLGLVWRGVAEGGGWRKGGSSLNENKSKSKATRSSHKEEEGGGGGGVLSTV